MSSEGAQASKPILVILDSESEEILEDGDTVLKGLFVSEPVKRLVLRRYT